MKQYKIIKVFITVLIFSAFFSCKKTLEKLNQNPNSATNIPPSTLFTSAELYATQMMDRFRGVGFHMMMVQQTASLTIADLAGDKYMATQNAASIFDFTYQTLAPLISSLINNTANDPQNKNLNAMAHIWRVLVYQRVTDTYGDIPYLQAGQGYPQSITKPAYDKQSDIYPAMLQELQDAINQLDANSPSPGAADVVYGGDITKWKKLAFSLMLRMGLRMSKVNPTLSQQWVNTAFNGGVILDNADNCLIEHSAGTFADAYNPIAYFMLRYNDLTTNQGEVKISKTFMDYMQSTADPRANIWFSLVNGDATPANQKGLPNGLDATGLTALGEDISVFSTFNTTYIVPNPNNPQPPQPPTFFVTAAENNLALAEAAVRGWISGSAATYYNNAVQAAMDQQTSYGASISSAQTAAYLAANPYPASGSQDVQLRTIAYQYWVSTFLDGFESYANWRRTGYPTLVPVNYPGNASNGTIPRRLTYPQSEYVNNADNINAALQSQGTDTYTTRVWWDAQ